MASKVIVAEKLSVAINSIKKDASEISATLGIDSSDLFQYVRGDAPYQEMIRAEQLAGLLGKIREKIAAPIKAAKPAASRAVPKGASA